MVIIDIETVSLREADEFLEPVDAPANYKDPEKIAAYCASRRVELLGKCALDPDLCRIVAVGYEHEDGRGDVLTSGSHDERLMLYDLWLAVSREVGIVGFNILGFDLPVLIRRSQYLGVPIPSTALSLDRYRTAHVDLMERLSFNGKLKMRSLDFYCKRFGIDVPDAHSGKDIEALVAANDWSAIRSHCRADLVKTRALAERLGIMPVRDMAPEGVF